MTLPIGTEVTYQGVRHTIIGYADNLGVTWYKIIPVGSTSIHYNTVSGKYFSDIVEPITIPPDVPGIPPGAMCVGPDLHQLIEGGLTGDLLEANSPTCGYAPPDDEPDDEIVDEPDDEVHDLMPGQTCVGSDLHQLISGGLIGDLLEANSPKCPYTPPEDKGIFGDIKSIYIVIALIAIIILGLLS